jgi:hypothetical protein
MVPDLVKAGDLGTGEGVDPSAGGLNARSQLSQLHHDPSPSPAKVRGALGTSSDGRSTGDGGGTLRPDLHRARACPWQGNRQSAHAHRAWDRGHRTLLWPPPHS